MFMKCILLELHFYLGKLWFAGLYLFFLFLIQNIDYEYSFEPPRRGGSNVYPQSKICSLDCLSTSHLFDTFLSIQRLKVSIELNAELFYIVHIVWLWSTVSLSYMYVCAT